MYPVQFALITWNFFSASSKKQHFQKSVVSFSKKRTMKELNKIFEKNFDTNVMDQDRCVFEVLYMSHLHDGHILHQLRARMKSFFYGKRCYTDSYLHCLFFFATKSQDHQSLVHINAQAFERLVKVSKRVHMSNSRLPPSAVAAPVRPWPQFPTTCCLSAVRKQD